MMIIGVVHNHKSYSLRFLNYGVPLLLKRNFDNDAETAIQFELREIEVGCARGILFFNFVRYVRIFKLFKLLFVMLYC